jgi:phosphate starvation-inducible PhoH-like protein
MGKTIGFQRRVPKNSTRKFKLQLNREQKEVKKLIFDNAVTVIKGNAGSGKTLVACQTALDSLFSKQIDSIVITRPTVSKEEIGFLPGDLREKMDPWISPIYANMYNLVEKHEIDFIIAEGKIEIVPVSFMRGRTFINSIVIVDEAQNITHDQMEMILSRLGTGSKMIICGDLRQTDLKNPEDTGFGFLNRINGSVPEFKICELKKNHRHHIVTKILKAYSDLT